MFYYFGFALVLVAAANGIDLDSSRSYRATSEIPKIWTIYSTPPPNELNPNLDSSTEWVGTTIMDPDELKPQGEVVILGYEPIYGYLNSTSDGPKLSRDWDFKCTRRFGYYRYEQSCDIYVECRNFRASRKVCPDGMHFKEKPSWSEYPCAYPPEAQCLIRGGALPPRPTAECPRQFGNFPIINDQYSKYDRCSSYISCASGIAHVMNCTFGLVFNPDINLCDWPEKVPGCRDVFDFYCPVPHLGEEDMVINYRYPSDPECRYFYSCLNGGYRVLACDEGLLFDHRIGRCVEYDNFVCETAAPIINLI